MYIFVPFYVGYLNNLNFYRNFIQINPRFILGFDTEKAAASIPGLTSGLVQSHL